MARVPIVNESYVEGNYSTPADRYHSGNASSSSSAHSRDTQSNNTIAEQVMNSPAYKSAYNVLSQESNKSWLQRLEMIPYSVSDASYTFLDDWGLSSNFNDKQDANYQYCMEQISALMSEYQSWKNSLPTTQTQQMADAGINSAITGQGVNGSSVPNVGVSTNPSALSSTQVGESLLNGASFILNSSSGLANIALQFKNLGLSSQNQAWTQDFSEKQATIAFREFASLNGIHLPPKFTFNDLVSGEFSDPKGEARYSDNLLDKFLTHHRNSPLIAGLATLYPEIVPRIHFNGYEQTSTGIAGTPVFLDATNKALIDMYSSEKEFDLKSKKYMATKASHEANGAQFDADTAKYNAIVAEKDKKQAEIYKEFIQKLYDSEHESDKLLLMYILFNGTYNTVELEQKQNEWFEVNATTGAVGNIL